MAEIYNKVELIGYNLESQEIWWAFIHWAPHLDPCGPLPARITFTLQATRNIVLGDQKQCVHTTNQPIRVYIRQFVLLNSNR